MDFFSMANLAIWTGLFLYTGYKFARCIRIVPNRKAFIVERLGKYHETLKPGFHILVPFIDHVSAVQDLREESIEVPPQDCFTKDNVRVEVDGVLYISIDNPEAATYGVTNHRLASILLAQTTIRSVIGTLELDRTFEEREDINGHVVSVLGQVADHWGIRVHRYEIKNIVPPVTVRDAMERQMAAERHRRALLATSEGQKESMVNQSEGRKQELINTSEGEMTRRINDAQGRAEEIIAIAEATAESIRKVGSAMATPGGAEAVRLRVSQDYFSKLRNLARGEVKVVLPKDLTDMEGLLSSIGLDAEAVRKEAEALAKTPPKALTPKSVVPPLRVPAAVVPAAVVPDAAPLLKT